MTHSGLAVLEARWWKDGNHSVRPLFETLCGIALSNPFGFRYDMFSDEGSFRTNVGLIGADKAYHSLYIASHGADREIQASTDITLPRTKIRNYIRDGNANYTIAGMYFGSCLICNEENARFFFDQQSGCRVNWIAGYSKTVDWIVSSSVDLMFWSFLLAERGKNKSRKKEKSPTLRWQRMPRLK